MENIAIIVGNSAYSNATNLDCCKADTKAIYELLESTKKYSHIVSFENTKSSELKDKLRELLGSFSEIDELFFYFTGHGYQINGEFFFCAPDFDQGKPNETGLSLTNLHDHFRAANTNLVVKVIDACYSGTLLLKNDGAFIPEPKDGFNAHIQIASCLDDQTSLTGEPLSEFTQQFIESAISKKEGTVYYTDIINTLRDRFLGNTHQTPHFVSQGTGREIFADSGKKFINLRASLAASVVTETAFAPSEDESGQVQISPFERLRVLDTEPPPICRRLQSKYGWSLWKKVTEQTDFRLKCAPARFG